MRLACLLFAAVMLAPAQIQDGPKPSVVLPSGKLQHDEVIKMEHQKTIEDAAQLLKLSQEVKDDFDQTGLYAVSAKTLKKLDDIDKLARGMRARIKRS